MFILKEPKWSCQKKNSVYRMHNRKLFQNKMYSLLCCNISTVAKRNYSVVLKFCEIFIFPFDVFWFYFIHKIRKILMFGHILCNVF